MNANTDATKMHTRKPVLAVLLSVAATGLGHIYCGRLSKGLILFFLSFTFAPIMVQGVKSASMPSTGVLLMIMGSLVFMVALFFYALVDAGLLARKIGNDYTLKEYNRWYLYIILIVVALGYPANMTYSIRDHVLQAFKVPSGSMAPSILPGDHVFLNKAVYQIKAPQRGDVVVFIYPDDRRKYFLKRLVALPGDSIEISNSQILINGNPLDYADIKPFPTINFTAQAETVFQEEINHNQRYAIMTNPKILQDMPKTIVPHGHCFVLGDNRSNSKDSRHFGPIPLVDVKGRVDYIHWPAQSWSRFGKYNGGVTFAK